MRGTTMKPAAANGGAKMPIAGAIASHGVWRQQTQSGLQRLA
jgi:hypothetical protein